MIGQSIQGINRLFILPFPKAEDQGVDGREWYRYYMSNAKIKSYDALIDAKTFFNQPIKTI